MLQAGAPLAQVQEGDVVQERDAPGDVPQDLDPGEPAADGGGLGHGSQGTAAGAAGQGGHGDPQIPLDLREEVLAYSPT